MIFLFICLILLGAAALYFSGRPESGFGYKGLAYRTFGKKTWQLSNRLAGVILLILGVTGGALYFALSQPTDRRFFWGMLLAVLAGFLISDLITIQRLKK